jgi:D-beta-D-heptose 7-phosphate kinase/D-beta-D-heptose 1-phosphate adenosyltransferase
MRALDLSKERRSFYERGAGLRRNVLFKHAGQRLVNLNLHLPSEKPLRILVAGEVILDRYIWGTVERISPEAPIPVLRLTRREERLGNAGFVCANLRALGAEVGLLSIIGADPDGRTICQMADELGIGRRSLLEEPQRPTIVKERLLGAAQSAQRGIQQLLRVDSEDPRPLDAEIEAKLLARLDEEVESADGVLVCDINKGLLTHRFLDAIIRVTRSQNKPVVIDPRRFDDFSIYRGATALTPNRYEAEHATGLSLAEPDSWPRAGRQLVDNLDLNACLVTLDRDGMFLAERGGSALRIETIPREVYDVSGAGDVVLTVFGLYLIAGLSAVDAATLANVAASVEVTKQGTSVISRRELMLALQHGHHSTGSKTLSLQELQAELVRHRHSCRKVCFANGCFDLLHAGHIKLLEFARAQGDLLVVGLNSDRSVRQIKGEGRPIYPAADRAEILAALQAVDYVVTFDEPHAEDIVRSIRPDVLVKGADWRGKMVDGQELVQSYGGKVVLAPLLEGRATARTIENILVNSTVSSCLQDDIAQGAYSEAPEHDR